MSGRTLIAALIIITATLVTVGTLYPAEMGALVGIENTGVLKLHNASTPEEAAQDLVAVVQRKDWKRAYSLIANSDKVDQAALVRDLNGSQGSLRTYSTLESAETKVLQPPSDGQALVRLRMKWASVVGTIWETRDLKMQQQQGRWLIEWPEQKRSKLPPQVIPVNYLRWDVIYRGEDDEWGAQDVDSPHVRIIAMNPVARDGGVVVLGELVNEDTVPAYVSVRATLLDKNDAELGKENSFDNISHLVLPRQVTPFRIDFPGMKLERVENIRMEPISTLVPASADPVVVVQDQQIKKSEQGSSQLSGKLENQSGQIVNIPQVLATLYNKNGQIIWVADSYVDRALLPKTPEPFSLNIPGDLAAQVADFRVMVSPYVAERLK